MQKACMYNAGLFCVALSLTVSIFHLLENNFVMPTFLSAQPIKQNAGIALVRLITGAFLFYHGLEVFDSSVMAEYGKWDMFKLSNNPMLMPYIGKSSELVAGALLILGLFTRIACIIVAGIMLYITFFVGHGKFWYEDQHPFMFVLMALALFFTGPGALSLDALLFGKARVRKY